MSSSVSAKEAQEAIRYTDIKKEKDFRKSLFLNFYTNFYYYFQSIERNFLKTFLTARNVGQIPSEAGCRIDSNIISYFTARVSSPPRTTPTVWLGQMI